jgi:sensor histidine kinase YesM
MVKRSFIRRIILYLAILILLLVCVLVAYAGSSYSILLGEIRQEANNFLQVYGGELKNRVTGMDTLLQDLLLQNFSELQLLKSANESKRFYASQDIHNYLRDVMQNDPGVNCLVVVDRSYGLCVDAEISAINYRKREALRAYTIQYAEKGSTGSTWTFVTLDGTTYLSKLHVYNGRAAAVYTSASDFLATIPRADYGDQTFILTDGSGIIVDFLGDGISRNDIGRSVRELRAAGAAQAVYAVSDGQILLHSRIDNVNMWKQVRIGMVVALAVILVTILFGALLVRYTQREMIRPMNRMAADMRRIDGGEHTLRIQGEYGTQEFTQLKDTFNSLMDEIVSLRIKAYEKLVELKDMELKCIRLQIRPHFFLNAITTITSLASQGKDRQIKAYVDSLSRNIRYMFKSGLHTIAAGEEIRHVENYIAMQECRYPGCIFHYIELPRELEQWRIPQMLIQTFIENEFKYAVSMDVVLTILIHISKREFDGQEMLYIRIEDDGKGYPEEVLRYMNGQAPYPENTGSRIGLWNVKRMMALMYERNDLIELGNIEPHGCVNRIRVPGKPVHELVENTAAETL